MMRALGVYSSEVGTGSLDAGAVRRGQGGYQRVRETLVGSGRPRSLAGCVKHAAGFAASCHRRPVIVHLFDESSPDGVTRSFAVFAEPTLASAMTSDIRKVQSSWPLAPRIDADVIVTHFTPGWQKLAFVHSLRLRNPGARLIHVEHSYAGAWEALMVPDPGRFRAMMRLWAKAFDAIAGVSDEQALWVRQAASLPAGSVRVTQPWSGRQGLDAVAEVTADRDRPLVIGAYGRLAYAKGFDVLIEAVKQLDPQRFALVIGGSGPEETALKRQAAGHATISFHGTVTDLPDFLGRCHVVVVPSRWEAFGLAATEARLAGRPVIASAVDGLAEQVGAAGLIADCSDAAALARILALLPELDLAAMGRAGRASLADAERHRAEAWLGPHPRSAARNGRWNGLTSSAKPVAVLGTATYPNG